jgi:hypothetical protein
MHAATTLINAGVSLQALMAAARLGADEPAESFARDRRPA